MGSVLRGVTLAPRSGLLQRDTRDDSGRDDKARAAHHQGEVGGVQPVDNGGLLSRSPPPHPAKETREPPDAFACHRASREDVISLMDALRRSIAAERDLGYRIILARDALCSSSDESHDPLQTGSNNSGKAVGGSQRRCFNQSLVTRRRFSSSRCLTSSGS
jgi:hypothetical protein